MAEALTEKLSELRGMVARVEEVMPRRQLVEVIDERIGRLEERIAHVSEHVKSIDAGTPEVRSLGERFADVRTALAAISADIGQTGHSVNELRDSLSHRLGDLRDLVEAGIARWEGDQSQMLERLSAIRDTLRDKLRDVTSQVEAAQSTFIGKIMGKDPGLKLKRDEWEQLSGKIEGIISGLESILAKKQARS